MNNLKQFWPVLLVMMIFTTACDKDDPVIPNESEVITTFTYTLTPQDGGDPVVLQFQDLDGDGGTDPVITGGDLAANTTYTGSIQLLNELESPSEDITEEVEEESDEHQFFFTSNIDGLSVTYSDEDENGMPVGLSTVFTTGDAGTGVLTITLRHEPDKYGEGVSSGEIDNAGGETDIEIDFDINVL